MKRIAAVALAYTAFIMSAAAQQGHEEHRVVIRHGGGHGHDMVRIDADNDGWLTRAEATAHAQTMFGELDTNSDGKLDGADRPADLDGDVVIERGAPPAPGAEAPRIERHVTVIRRGDDAVSEAPAPPRPPMPPRPPRPPMFVMMFANTEEADRNGDGALSREEFVTQQLRFFDAGDGNGDGRIRFEPPPEPPEPPEPPAPPRR